MATNLPSRTLKRARLSSPCSCGTQIRHASLLRRPHRPYTFTQLVTLSDGSTYLSRTTSPTPVYKSTKDTRNHPLWQPSLKSLRNVEQDEAGRLRAFRNKFGRGWDLDAKGPEEGTEEGHGQREDSLMELISGAGAVSPAVKIKVKDEVVEPVKAEMVTVRGPDGKLVRVHVSEDKKRRDALREAGGKK